MDNTNNKKFWDDYVTYWENKVKEANEDPEARDKTPDDLLLEEYYRKLGVKPNEKFLDYGCGSCRLFPIYKNNTEGRNINYYGIDISGVPLEHAKNNYAELKVSDGNLQEFDGVNIPFSDGFFDKIVCYGVFDACNQEHTINELLRVLKVEGTLLITGKNNNYFIDDEAAAVAEVNARKKGHPNYFTDVHSLIEQLEDNDVSVVDQYFFLRRGDFTNNRFVKDIPDTFYEFALILRKGKNTKSHKYEQFSDKYSLYKRKRES
jgi:ubiquinone/menaquinone biosynthesis C-methylase UbiE